MHHLRLGVPDHKKVRQLMPYSYFVRFIVKTRNFFMNEFTKYRHEFNGINGECLFLGTVLHSLDHTQISWIARDPIWFSTLGRLGEGATARFGLMAEMVALTKCAFNDDLPGLLFEKRFKNVAHPFYRAVYAHAATVDRRLADNMDCCIIK